MALSSGVMINIEHWTSPNTFLTHTVPVKYIHNEVTIWNNQSVPKKYTHFNWLWKTLFPSILKFTCAVKKCRFWKGRSFWSTHRWYHESIELKALINRFVFLRRFRFQSLFSGRSLLPASTCTIFLHLDLDVSTRKKVRLNARHSLAVGLEKRFQWPYFRKHGPITPNAGNPHPTVSG